MSDLSFGKRVVAVLVMAVVVVMGYDFGIAYSVEVNAPYNLLKFMVAGFLIGYLVFLSVYSSASIRDLYVILAAAVSVACFAVIFGSTLPNNKYQHIGLSLLDVSALVAFTFPACAVLVCTVWDALMACVPNEPRHAGHAEVTPQLGVDTVDMVMYRLTGRGADRFGGAVPMM